MKGSPVTDSTATLSNLSLPRTPDELTVHWLTESLDASGVAHGPILDFTTVVLGEGAGLAGIVVRVVPRYADGVGPASLIAKFSTTNEANLNTMAAFDLYRREVTFYRTLASKVKGRCPDCYRAEISDDGRACVLLLEDFPDHAVGNQVTGCSVAEARLLVVEAAKLHATFWGAAAPDGVRPYKGLHGQMAEHMATAMWPGAIANFPDSVPERIREVHSEFLAALPALHDWIMTAPTTVTHGDFRLDNLLFGPAGHSDPVVLLDWQGVLWSKGIQDISYLLTQSIDPAQRREHEKPLLETYRAELASLGVDYAEDQCWLDYRRTALCNFAIAIAIGGLEATNDRARVYQQATLERAVAAFEDLDLLALVREDPLAG